MSKHEFFSLFIFLYANFFTYFYLFILHNYAINLPKIGKITDSNNCSKYELFMRLIHFKYAIFYLFILFFKTYTIIHLKIDEIRQKLLKYKLSSRMIFLFFGQNIAQFFCINRLLFSQKSAKFAINCWHMNFSSADIFLSVWLSGINTVLFCIIIFHLLTGKIVILATYQ